jgi:lipid II:glycine glycyltransferase (peptidoglycan interpeptide bridge formation enzyme)
MIKEITKEAWKEFNREHPPITFLQSIAWFDFNETLGDQTWVCGQFEGKNLISTCLIILIDARRGRHLLIPHGPNGNVDLAHLQQWKECWKSLAVVNKCSFIRWQPVLDLNDHSLKLAKQAGFKKAPLHAHTEYTTKVDISSSEKEILLSMRKTTRQMIQKGKKLIASGEVIVSYPSEISNEMLNVYQNTYIRGGAVAYSNQYVQNEWRAFRKHNQAHLVTVHHDSVLLSWGMFLFSGPYAFYHQGGNVLSKTIPASYICQWEGISEAKKRGCTSYDFWGVAPKEAKNHPWSNISMFKRGFGGNDVEYLHAQDLIISWKYWGNWLLESYRARKRGFR